MASVHVVVDGYGQSLSHQMFRLESGTGSLNSFVSTWSRNRGDILQPQTYLFSLSSTVITFPIEI